MITYTRAHVCATLFSFIFPLAALFVCSCVSSGSTSPPLRESVVQVQCVKSSASSAAPFTSASLSVDDYSTDLFSRVLIVGVDNDGDEIDGISAIYDPSTNSMVVNCTEYGIVSVYFFVEPYDG